MRDSQDRFPPRPEQSPNDDLLSLYGRHNGLSVPAKLMAGVLATAALATGGLVVEHFDPGEVSNLRGKISNLLGLSPSTEVLRLLPSEVTETPVIRHPAVKQHGRFTLHGHHVEVIKHIHTDHHRKKHIEAKNTVPAQLQHHVPVEVPVRIEPAAPIIPDVRPEHHSKPDTSLTGGTAPSTPQSPANSHHSGTNGPGGAVAPTPANVGGVEA